MYIFLVFWGESLASQISSILVEENDADAVLWSCPGSSLLAASPYTLSASIFLTE